MNDKTIQTVAERVIAIIADQVHVNIEECTPEASIVADLGADSLDTIELVMAFEEAFDLEISDEDASTIVTVKDAITYLEQRLAMKART